MLVRLLAVTLSLAAVLPQTVPIALAQPDRPRHYDDYDEGGGSSRWDQDAWDSNVPKLAQGSTYSWVNPSQAFVMNGKLVWTEVRHDLWGHTGVEASAMADGLGLNFPSPNYRKHFPGGIKQEDHLAAVSKPGTCKFIWSRDCRNSQALEVDKVWYHSGNLNRFVVVTWDDTYWNGQRLGSGYYKRGGRRFVRFDEVVPAFGGTVRKDDRGLVWVEMPPRISLEAGEACALNKQIESCDVTTLLFPEAVGTRGNEDTF